MQTPAARRALVLALALVTVASTTTARAADDAALADLLVEKGYVTEEEIAAARAGDAESVEEEVVVETEEAKPAGVDVSVGPSGLIATSPDGRFEFGLGGRLQIDVGGFTGNVTPLGDGIQLRRGRIKSFGTVYEDWDFKLEVNFDGNGEVFPTDAWIRYAGYESVSITVGHQKVPFSMQSMTSSNWQVFQERGLPDALIDSSEEGRRRLGVRIDQHGDHYVFQTGVFGEGLTDPGVVDEDWGVAGRLLIAPIAERTRVVAFGGAVYYREFQSGSQLQYRSRPESNLASVRLVDTGLLPNAQDDLSFNAEASVVCGPFHAQGEYTRADVDRWGDVPAVFDGWYVQAGWFLTGESRNFDLASGQYKRIKPERRVGAWEIATRYSRIDLQDQNVFGGRESDVTVGLNWWVNQSVMFRFNYVRGDLSPTTFQVTDPAPQIPQDLNAFMARAQLVF